MSGLKVIRSLLINHVPLTTLVPITRIVADELPQDTALPAISISLVSSVDRNIVQPGLTRRVTERVQAMVMARDATERKTLIGHVRKAAADKLGTIADVPAVAVHTESQGPDLTSEGGIRMRPQDFMVSFNEST